MLRHDVTCDGIHGSYKGTPAHNRVSFRNEASRSQAGEGVAKGRSVSFPSQGTRVIVITRDVPFRGNSHCVVENDSLGNECPLGHAPRNGLPYSETELRHPSRTRAHVRQAY